MSEWISVKDRLPEKNGDYLVAFRDVTKGGRTKMIHLGDITKISGCDAPPVDVVIGGSPCQDLSVAGKRAGLAGARSGLFMEQIRIIKEMREADVRRGRTGKFIRPRFMVWENVPGAFSSNKGEDFRAVLEETIRVSEPEAPDVPLPAKGKWTMADCWMGDGWSVAYRVLDAQFWGVPQRRRRIALVADFGGHAAPEILFVRKSVSGDSAEIGSAGQADASTDGTGAETAIALRMRAGCEGGGKGPLIQIEKSGVLMCGNDQTIFCFRGNTITPDAVDRHAVAYVMATGQANAETAPTLTGDHENRVTDYAALVLAFKYHQGTGAGGIGAQEELAPTLCADGGHPPAVFAVDCRNFTLNTDVNGTLQAKSTGGQSLNLNHVVLSTEEDGAITFNGRPCAVIWTQVRRLTPMECERLQGYPDGWTDIGPWTDSAGKLHKESSDSARYKALGNSIALPPWAWVLKRLCACYERTATMASLFDGIGGFPLIWERLNGPGSCLWASEIEEFPIAVTKRRFGEKETEHAYI